MSQTPRIETPPRTRRSRWRVLVALALLALLAVAIAVGWWNYRKPLSDEERQMVGVWRFQPDGPQRPVLIEIELRADRTCRWRGVNLTTGEVSAWDDPYGSSWRMSGDRLVIHHPDSTPGTIWYFISSKLSVDVAIVLTPDGPDRFRYESRLEDHSNKRGPPATGTISRVTPTE